MEKVSIHEKPFDFFLRLFGSFILPDGSGALLGARGVTVSPFAPAW